MKTKWVVVNVGCIECGVSSQIVGVFNDELIADEVIGQCKKHYHWREGGQNEFDKFPLPKPNVIHKDYVLVSLPKADA